MCWLAQFDANLLISQAYIRPGLHNDDNRWLLYIIMYATASSAFLMLRLSNVDQQMDFSTRIHDMIMYIVPSSVFLMIDTL